MRIVGKGCDRAALPPRPLADERPHASIGSEGGRIHAPFVVVEGEAEKLDQAVRATSTSVCAARSVSSTEPR
ncbi:hypothetical protein ADK93_03475 [Streptomyces sp. XY58]|nr:hypothetical protein ADK93_03475 [Streptomyces sp. XY58]KOV39456.1 hypothetical protein ADK99_36385 [Streptomyces sp. MMG1064]